MSRGGHSSTQTWLDTARYLPTGTATPAQMRQSILHTRHRELPAPDLWGESRGAVHRDPRQAVAVNPRGISHQHVGQQGVGSHRGVHEPEAPAGVQIWGPMGLRCGRGGRKFCGRIIESCSLTFCQCLQFWFTCCAADSDPDGIVE